MPQNSLSNTTRRATKLTDKAQAALEDRLIRKRNMMATEVMETRATLMPKARRPRAASTPALPFAGRRLVSQPSSATMSLMTQQQWTIPMEQLTS
jgi:hypothetical protein